MPRRSLDAKFFLHPQYSADACVRYGFVWVHMKASKGHDIRGLGSFFGFTRLHSYVCIIQGLLSKHYIRIAQHSTEDREIRDQG